MGVTNREVVSHSVIQSKHANALHSGQLVFSPLKVIKLSGKVKVELLSSAVVFRSMSLISVLLCNVPEGW